MDTIVKHVFEHMPPAPKDMYEQFSSNSMAIFKADIIFPASAQFDCFEFVIPQRKFPETVIERKKFFPENGKIFAVNPGESHKCVINRIEKGDYTAMFVSRTLLCETARILYKKNDLSFLPGSFAIDNATQIYIQLFKNESVIRQTGSELILDCLGTQIAVQLLRQVKNSLNGKEESRNYKDGKGISKVVEYMREHYNSDCSMKDIAGIANLSPYHFIRVFKAETGKTPHAFLLDIKIEKACSMLKQGNYSITEVCFLAGFRNLSYFTTLFRMKTGLSPSQYKNRTNGDCQKLFY